MLTVATAAAAIVVLLNHQHVATAFYLPGVNPHNYRRGEVYVNPMVGCWLVVADSNWFGTNKVFVFVVKC
jgi:hypothetical protein